MMPVHVQVAGSMVISVATYTLVKPLFKGASAAVRKFRAGIRRRWETPGAPAPATATPSRTVGTPGAPAVIEKKPRGRPKQQKDAAPAKQAPAAKAAPAAAKKAAAKKAAPAKAAAKKAAPARKAGKDAELLILVVPLAKISGQNGVVEIVVGMSQTGKELRPIVVGSLPLLSKQVWRKVVSPLVQIFVTEVHELPAAGTPCNKDKTAAFKHIALSELAQASDGKHAGGLTVPAELAAMLRDIAADLSVRMRDLNTPV